MNSISFMLEMVFQEVVQILGMWEQVKNPVSFKNSESP